MIIAYDHCGDEICIRVRGFWCRQPCVVCGGKTDGRTHIIAGEFHCQRCCPVHGDAVLQHQERGAIQQCAIPSVSGWVSSPLSLAPSGRGPGGRHAGRMKGQERSEA
jgi:hypothetical protein